MFSFSKKLVSIILTVLFSLYFSLPSFSQEIKPSNTKDVIQNIKVKNIDKNILEEYSQNYLNSLIGGAIGIFSSIVAIYFASNDFLIPLERIFKIDSLTILIAIPLLGMVIGSMVGSPLNYFLNQKNKKGNRIVSITGSIIGTTLNIMFIYFIISSNLNFITTTISACLGVLNIPVLLTTLGFNIETLIGKNKNKLKYKS